MMKVPSEPGLTPNNGLGNAILSEFMASNPRKGQAKRFGVCWASDSICLCSEAGTAVLTKQ